MISVIYAAIYLNINSVTVFDEIRKKNICKKIFVEKISNLRTISFPNVPYILKKGKPSWIKFLIFTIHLRSLNDQNSFYYTFLFGEDNMNDSENVHIFVATIPDRLNVPLFDLINDFLLNKSKATPPLFFTYFPEIYKIHLTLRYTFACVR